MNNELLVSIVLSAVLYGTPLLFAGLGELLAERSGVLNLGVEGMMLMGAVSAFWVSQNMAGDLWFVLFVAVLAGALAGGAMALLHAALTISLRANQIVSGLALTIFAGAAGLSSYLGRIGDLGAKAGKHQLPSIDVLGLKDLPIAGPILFHQDALVYFSWALVALVTLYLYRTRAGLYVRAVGESPESADAMGISVTKYRYAHTVVGGLFAGVAGAYFTLSIAPNWTDGMTAGAGWIAIALVIFAFWRPELLIVGAYVFGAVASLGFDLQARGVRILPSEFFSALPYVITVFALVLVSTGWARSRLGAPAALGVPYVREEA